MKVKKKICIITPFLANGGLERVAFESAKSLSKAYDITLVVMDTFHVDYEYFGKLIDLNVSLMSRNIFMRVYNFIISIVKLKKLIREHKFDLVISHGELSNFPNILSGLHKKVLVVHNDRWNRKNDIQGQIVNMILKCLYSFKKISKILTVSEGARINLIFNANLDRDRVICIHNSFNIEKIIKLANQKNKSYADIFANNKNVIVTAGRLTFVKGQWYLLRIFNELKKMILGAKLVILGHGNLNNKLISYSKSLGLKTYSIWSDDSLDHDYDVYFLGFQKNPYQFFSQARLTVMTSLSEGFGNTIVEAMACSSTVVSTDCKSGPREIICPSIFQETNLNYPIYGDFGVLMPTFKQKFIFSNEELSKNEKLWVKTLYELLITNDDFLINYSKLSVGRSNDFNSDVITSKWMKLIDGISDEISEYRRN